MINSLLNRPMTEEFDKVVVNSIQVPLDGYVYLSLNRRDAERLSGRTTVPDVEHMREYIHITKQNIVEMYLKSMEVMELPDCEMRPQSCDHENRSYYAQKIMRLTDRIYEDRITKTDSMVSYKIQSESRSIFVVIFPLNDDEYQYTIDLYDFNGDLRLFSAYNFSRGKTSSANKWIQTSVPIIYRSDRSSKTSECMKKLYAVGPRTPTPELYRLFYDSLKWWMNLESPEDRLQVHSEFEMKIMVDTIKSYYAQEKVWINVKSWLAEGYAGTKIAKRVQELDGGQDVVLPDWFNSSKSEYPLVDLNPKEWEFVNRYVSKQKVFSDPNRNYDLLSAIKQARYGTDLRFNLESYDDLEHTYPISMHLELHEDDDLLRTMYVWEETETVKTMAVIDFTDLSSFHGPESLVMLRSDVMIDTSVNGYPACRSDVYDMIPPLFRDREHLLSLATTYIGMLVILHDRPERTRMVKEITTVESKTERHPNRKHDKAKKKESNVIIRRILKPTRDAKEYVAKMTASGHSNREYVLEEWSRVGHWRTLKNGNSIWIGETTCRRHLPMADGKELHIKL